MDCCNYILTFLNISYKASNQNRHLALSDCAAVPLSARGGRCFPISGRRQAGSRTESMRLLTLTYLVLKKAKKKQKQTVPWKNTEESLDYTANKVHCSKFSLSCHLRQGEK